MGQQTNISWCDHTWSPWLGCEPVSPGCAHCYASSISKRAGRGAYRVGMTRTLTKHWEQVKRWNDIESDKETLREFVGNAPLPADKVFPSMCDPFDEAVPVEWKERFWKLVEDTPSLTWLILTKRPENVSTTYAPENVWLGVSVENQEMADKRIPILLSIPASVRFLSVEPMLGLVDLGRWIVKPCEICCSGNPWHETPHSTPVGWKPGISWVIIGGESGFNHRRMEIGWMRSIADQCKAAGVPVFIKQDSHRFPGQQGRIPDDLWALKQFPKP